VRATTPSNGAATDPARNRKDALALALTLTFLAILAAGLAGGVERAGTAARSIGRVAAAAVVEEPKRAAATAGGVLGARSEEAPLSQSDAGIETPAFDQYGSLITVCHAPGFRQQTLRVATAETHLAHGDYIGPCW
jgi:hypothetical protein